MTSKTNHLVFRSEDTLGSNDAEDDKEYLLNCFIDVGDYNQLLDFSNKRCLVLGRTGIGKTALITKLQEEHGDKVIVIKPESLAMQHITNSTIIRYMNDLGIELNTFYKLLWRHALCVEIFQHHFKAVDRAEGEDILSKLRYRFKKQNTHNYRALNYLEEWKDSFWEVSDSHVVEMVSKTEKALQGTVGAAYQGMGGEVKGNTTITDEEKTEVKKRAQSVVNDLQMKEVSDLLEMLNEVIEDRLQRYYIVIDKLDEGWVDDSLRYKLIKSLIETVRDINRVENIKPIVLLRVDLLGHVFDLTKDIGFQEEKYRSLYLDVHWTREQLIDMIDSRIDYLLKSRYQSNKKIRHTDILPDEVCGQPTIDYIIQRSLMRPRDLIEFFNICIREAVNNKTISPEQIVEAEREYSRRRLESIKYEWKADYPGLSFWLKILKKRPASFSVGDIQMADVRDLCLEYAVDSTIDGQSLILDKLYIAANKVVNNQMTIDKFRDQLIFALYNTSVVGLELESGDKSIWSFEMKSIALIDDINDNTVICIHPCFWSALKTVV